MGYNILINGVYWGYNPLTNHLLTFWDIQVINCPESKHHLRKTAEIQGLVCYWNSTLDPSTTKLGVPWSFSEVDLWVCTSMSISIFWIYPPPRMPVANEGLVRDSLLKMVHNPGGDCYWVGGRPNLYIYI